MNNFFLSFAYSGYSPKVPSVIASFLALIISLFILLYFNEKTLFLAALLVSIIAIRSINKYEQNGGEHHAKHVVIDKFSGIGFALSVAPAMAIPLAQLSELSNGFIIQALLSFVLFLHFDKEKHSLIGKISREAKGGIGIVGDDILAGFTAGIVSSLLWQAYLQAQVFLG